MKSLNLAEGKNKEAAKFILESKSFKSNNTSNKFDINLMNKSTSIYNYASQYISGKNSRSFKVVKKKNHHLQPINKSTIESGLNDTKRTYQSTLSKNSSASMKPYHESLAMNGLTSCQFWRQSNVSPGPAAAYNIPGSFDKYSRFTNKPTMPQTSSNMIATNISIKKEKELKVYSSLCSKKSVQYLKAEKLKLNHQKRKFDEKMKSMWLEQKKILDLRKMTPGPGHYDTPTDNISRTQSPGYQGSAQVRFTITLFVATNRLR